MGWAGFRNEHAMQCSAALFIAFGHMETYAPKKWEG